MLITDKGKIYIIAITKDCNTIINKIITTFVVRTIKDNKMSSERRFLIPSRVFRNFITKPLNSNYKLMKRITKYRLPKVYLACKYLHNIVNQHINKLINNLTPSVHVHLVSFSWRSSILNVALLAFKKGMSWIKGLFSKGINKDTVALGLTFQSPYPASLGKQFLVEIEHFLQKKSQTLSIHSPITWA
jgi:hypothetical protein